MILGITGHRPDRLGSYTIPNPTHTFVVSEARKILQTHNPDKVITGMCIGFDLWIAELCLELRIPYIAAMPFIGQELLWPPDTQKHYRHLLSQADHTVIVSKGGFASWKMQARNQWIVDNCDTMLAAFDEISKGGTHNCVEYAKSKYKDILIINPLKSMR